MASLSPLYGSLVFWDFCIKICQKKFCGGWLLVWHTCVHWHTVHHACTCVHRLSRLYKCTLFYRCSEAQVAMFYPESSYYTLSSQALINTLYGSVLYILTSSFHPRWEDFRPGISIPPVFCFCVSVSLLSPSGPGLSWLVSIGSLSTGRHCTLGKRGPRAGELKYIISTLYAIQETKQQMDVLSWRVFPQCTASPWCTQWTVGQSRAVSVRLWERSDTSHLAAAEKIKWGKYQWQRKYLCFYWAVIQVLAQVESHLRQRPYMWCKLQIWRSFYWIVQKFFKQFKMIDKQKIECNMICIQKLKLNTFRGSKV